MKNEILRTEKALSSLEQGAEQRFDHYLDVVFEMDIDEHQKKRLISAYMTQAHETILQQVKHGYHTLMLELHKYAQENRERDKASQGYLLSIWRMIRSIRRRITTLQNGVTTLLDKNQLLVQECTKPSTLVLSGAMLFFLTQEMVKAFIGGDNFFESVCTAIKSKLKGIDLVHSLYLDMIQYCPTFLVQYKEAAIILTMTAATWALRHAMLVPTPFRRGLEFVKSLFQK